MKKPVSIPELMRMKSSGEKIVMATACNHWQMRLAEEHSFKADEGTLSHLETLSE
ncbi:MAG: hypothetical protein Q7I97_04545 [Thermovirgaceae bacterium]|nr:hypothetical protein [Thermovirgaceae bacterium]